MKKVGLIALSAVALGLLMSTGCMNREPAPVCPVPTELTSSNPTLGGFEGVDMIVVVDDSGSMEKEQEILATAFFPLINALVNPLPTWDFEATENLRVAIVSTNMGLQWDGNGYSAADGFPPSAIGEKCADPKGDNGVFKSGYDATVGGSVNITPGVIHCEAADPNVSQCPPGWNCQNPDADGVGECFPVTGDGTNQLCPDPPSSLGSSYLTLKNDPDDTVYLYEKNELAMATACLSKLGIEGCGFEQQLVAAAVGLETPGQGNVFMREKSLLVVLIVSDEEDCSIENGPELFASDEVQNDNSVAINTACGKHPEFLFTPTEIRDRYYQAKAVVSGASASGAVLFAAIIGVPPTDPCQGKGSALGECLAQPEMQLNVIQNPAQTNPQLIFDYACERFAADGTTPVTQASPGIRYVQLAQEYGSLSYIYSICNADWSPAMDEIARLIASNIAGTCYAKRLDWDAATETALCNAVVKVNGNECPALPAGMAWYSEEQVGTTDLPVMACTIPKIPTAIECPAEGTPERAALQELEQTAFGWYYCENEGENFSDACDDGIDNDGQGGADCEDSQCAECKNCAADGNGDTTICQNKCRYMITLTDEALSQAKSGIEIQCLQQFSFEDPNCQENTSSSCNDMEDNDGNGPYDCDSISRSEVEEDESLGPPRNADPYCCGIDQSEPVIFSNGQRICNVELEDATRICGGESWSDACREAAKILNCTLP